MPRIMQDCGKGWVVYPGFRNTTLDKHDANEVVRTLRKMSRVPGSHYFGWKFKKVPTN